MNKQAQDLTTRAREINPFKASKTTEDSTAMAGAMSAQAAASVQGAVLMAKKFPRDQAAAMERILDACTRVGLAEDAEYAYPRGGKTVTGPTIRIAEVIAQNWCNIDFGIIEISQEHGRSQMMAYCWDLETNVRRTQVFVTEHKRKAHGKINVLTDPRDIYELTANLGARRVRACILGVIPGDVKEAAIKQCRVTLANSMQAPEEEIKSMIAAFEKLGVTERAVKQRLGKSFKAVTAAEVIRMRQIYASLRDGMSKPEIWFPPESNGAITESTEDLKKRLRAGDDQPITPLPEEQAETDTGPSVDSQGEPFDADLHVADKETGKPVLNQDGSFRKRPQKAAEGSAESGDDTIN